MTHPLCPAGQSLLGKHILEGDLVGSPGETLPRPGNLVLTRTDRTASDQQSLFDSKSTRHAAGVSKRPCGASRQYTSTTTISQQSSTLFLAAVSSLPIRRTTCANTFVSSMPVGIFGTACCVGVSACLVFDSSTTDPLKVLDIRTYKSVALYKSVVMRHYLCNDVVSVTQPYCVMPVLTSLQAIVETRTRSPAERVWTRTHCRPTGS